MGDEWSYLCFDCCKKVRRAGREPHNTIEAILIFNCDPDVGSPTSPLDHEDYRDLELLGLWPETQPTRPQCRLRHLAAGVWGFETFPTSITQIGVGIFVRR